MSKTDICNLALMHVGGQRIDDLSQKHNRNATICTTYYDPARLFLFEKDAWTFIRQRQVLAQETNNQAVNEWEYTYALPTDKAWLRPLAIIPTGTSATNTEAIPFDHIRQLRLRIPFEVRDGFFLTNESSVDLLYAVDQRNTGKFSDSFKMALSFYLAWLMAESFNKPRAFHDRVFAKFRTHLSEALRHDHSLVNKNREIESDILKEL